MERVRLAYPNMIKIWENSSLMLAAGETMLTTMEVEEECRMDIEAGKLTLDSEYVPEGLKGQVPKRK